MSQGERYWPTFCQALDRPNLIEDERFASEAVRYENREELIEMLASIFLTRTREEWGQAMDAAGDLIYERVRRTLDLVDDPQVVGRTKWLQTPVTYSKTPLSTRKMAPAHGEDTERLLIELLDYTWDDIASLQGDGVIL